MANDVWSEAIVGEGDACGISTAYTDSPFEVSDLNVTMPFPRLYRPGYQPAFLNNPGLECDVSEDHQQSGADLQNYAS